MMMMRLPRLPTSGNNEKNLNKAKNLNIVNLEVVNQYEN